MAGTYFRQSGWRILISAVASGGKSHVSPLGAPARPEMAIFFGGGHFRQQDWAEVYICKKIPNNMTATLQLARSGFFTNMALCQMVLLKLDLCKFY
jgi:hypothetical protein